MSLLDDVKRRLVASRAAEFLRDKDAEWSQGYWIADARDAENNLDAQTSIGDVRKWLKGRGWDKANKRREFPTNVCLEGALLLALADDPSIPNDRMSHELLSEFTFPAGDIALQEGWVSEGKYESIPGLNDSGQFTREKALRLLERLGE